MVVFLGHSGTPDLECLAIVVGAIPVNALGNDDQTLAADPVDPRGPTSVSLVDCIRVAERTSTTDSNVRRPRSTHRETIERLIDVNVMGEAWWRRVEARMAVTFQPAAYVALTSIQTLFNLSLRERLDAFRFGYYRFGFHRHTRRSRLELHQMADDTGGSSRSVGRHRNLARSCRIARPNAYQGRWDAGHRWDARSRHFYVRSGPDVEHGAASRNAEPVRSNSYGVERQVWSGRASISGVCPVAI